MKCLMVAALAGAVLVGCATSPSATDSDMSKEFSVSLKDLYEASKAVCRNMGARIIKSEISGEGASVTALSETTAYVVFLTTENDSVKVTLVVGRPREWGGRIAIFASSKKSDYDRFSTALHARLTRVSALAGQDTA